ncbi:MAG: hypothetical protein AB1938_30080 [Myxococcota bacterium]
MVRLASGLMAAVVWLGCGGGGGGGTDGGMDGGCTEVGKSPPNLVRNYGFECGGASPSEWAAVYGALEFVSGEGRNGTRAAKLTTDPGGARFTYAPDLVSNGGQKTYCVTAWAKGTAPFMRIRVLRDEGGGGFTNFEFNSPVPRNWERVPPSITLQVPNAGSPKLQLVFELQTNRGDGQNAMPGDVLFVDDVDAWESASGRCDEVR